MKLNIGSVDRIARVVLGLARTSHQLSTAADDASYPDGFSRLGMLNVLTSTPARPKARKPVWPRRLVALVTKPGEKCGLAIAAAGLYFKSWFGMIALIPLGAALVGWCPLYAPFGLSTCKLRSERSSA